MHRSHAWPSDRSPGGWVGIAASTTQYQRAACTCQQPQKHWLYRHRAAKHKLHVIHITHNSHCKRAPEHNTPATQNKHTTCVETGQHAMDRRPFPGRTSATTAEPHSVGGAYPNHREIAPPTPPPPRWPARCCRHTHVSCTHRETSPNQLHTSAHTRRTPHSQAELKGYTLGIARYQDARNIYTSWQRQLRQHTTYKKNNTQEPRASTTPFPHQMRRRV